MSERCDLDRLWPTIQTIESVGADFEHFAPHVVEGGIVAFRRSAGAAGPT